MPFQPSEIGTRYDVGFATRDGTTIGVRNKDGKTVQLSSVAFMLSTDKTQSPYKEATELQEKAKLTQLSSTNLIDREFDQWPQISQGDWSGGIGQRVFQSNGENNQYWDGQGLVWPLNDTVPSIPLSTDQTATYPGTAGPPAGMWGGYLTGVGNGYCGVFGVVNGGNWNLRIRFYSSGAAYTTTITTNTKHRCYAACVALGSIWVVAGDDVAGGNITLYQIDWSGAGVALVVTTSVNVVINQLAGAAPKATGQVAAAALGNKQYVAVALNYEVAAANRLCLVSIYDVSAIPPFGAATTINFPSTLIAVNDTRYRITDLAFLGDTLYIAATDGFHCYIMSSPPPFSTTSTTARLDGGDHIYCCAVGGQLFIVVSASTFGLTSSGITITLYLLTGASLTELGPLSPMPGGVGFIPSTVVRPVAFTDYAVFGFVDTALQGHVYAFDVIRNRLFHVLDIDLTGAAATGSDAPGTGLAVFGNFVATISGLASTADWGLAIFKADSGVSGLFAQQFAIGVVDGSGNRLRLNTSITSGIIDFTSATIKNFRQAVAVFIGGLMPGVSGIGVTLNLWFDKNPENLGAPDVTVNTGTPPNPLPPILDLNAVANRLGRKLVYQVITTGGGGSFSGALRDAPLVTGVVIQAATGWVLDVALALSPNAKTNGQAAPEYCFQVQGTDHVAAYNFLKQLWRQKGGEFTVTWPNGDSYSALIQQMEFDSPKPFAVALRSDQQSTMQQICLIKIREDV